MESGRNYGKRRFARPFLERSDGFLLEFPFNNTGPMLGKGDSRIDKISLPESARMNKTGAEIFRVDSG